MIELVRELSQEQLTWRNDPDVRLTTRQSGIISKEEHELWLDKIRYDPTCVYFGVMADNRIVGYVGFTSMSLDHSRAHRTAEYSILIAPKHAGNGYGTSALGALLDYGFKVIGLATIYGEILATNGIGKAIADKFGFKTEGVLRSRYFKEGKRVDSFMVSITEAEWSARSSPLSA